MPSSHILGLTPLVFFFCAPFFGVARAQKSKLWHQVMAIFPCYATGLAAMCQFFISFVRYACAHTSEICTAAYAKFAQLSKVNRFWCVYVYLARLTIPNADLEYFPGCEPTQCLGVA